MSSDEDLVGGPAFLVEGMDDELDLGVPPTSGQEYLRRVQMEAKQCPAIVVADLDTSSFHKQQTVKVLPNRGYHPAPNGYAPPLDVQKQQVHEFSQLRQKVVHNKVLMKKRGHKPKQRLPLPEDVDRWCALCFGPLNTQKMAVDPSAEVMCMSASDQEAGGGNMGTASAAHQETGGGDRSAGSHATSGTPPLMSIVAYMDQPTIIQVLEYHVNWFEATGFSTEQGRWFFALLACLEKPLPPEACSLLRSLARSCTSLRAALEDPSDGILVQLNLLICIVARYFDQTDLADNT